MASLFPQQQGGRGGASTSILEFKVGRCNLTRIGDKFRVTADKRRGNLSLSKDNDGLMVIKWTDRSTGSIEDRRVAFPNEMVFKKIKTGREGDRVYMLKFHSNEPLLFWMQDKDASKDEENASKLNEYVNNPSSIPAAPAAQDPFRNILSRGNGNQLQGLDLSAILGTIAAGNAAPTPPVPAPAPTPAPAPVPTPTTQGNFITMEDLQRAMMAVPAPSSSSTQRSPPLQELFTSEAIFQSGILNDAEIRSRLREHLPEGHQTDDFLDETIRSPQFRQSLGALTNALQSDSFNSIMANLGINPEPGMPELIRNDVVGAFITALQAQYPHVPAPASSDPSTSTDMDTGTNNDESSSSSSSSASSTSSSSSTSPTTETPNQPNSNNDSSSMEE